jgi:hypothetical protein
VCVSVVLLLLLLLLLLLVDVCSHTQCRASFVQGLQRGGGESVLVGTSSGAVLNMPLTLASSDVLFEEPSAAAIHCVVYDDARHLLLVSSASAVLTAKLMK